MDEPRVPGSEEPSTVPLPCLPHVHMLVSLASKLARALARPIASPTCNLRSLHTSFDLTRVVNSVLLSLNRPSFLGLSRVKCLGTVFGCSHRSKLHSTRMATTMAAFWDACAHLKRFLMELDRDQMKREVQEKAGALLEEVHRRLEATELAYRLQVEKLPKTMHVEMHVALGVVWILVQGMMVVVATRMAVRTYRRKRLVVQERTVRFREPLVEERNDQGTSRNVPAATVEETHKQIRRRHTKPVHPKEDVGVPPTLPSFQKSLGRPSVKLWLVQGKGLEKDQGGRLDPYVRVRIWYCRDPHGPQKTYEYHEKISSVQEDTGNPTWNDFFHIVLDEGEILNRVELWVMDWHLLESENSIGHGWLKLKDKPADGQERQTWVPLSQGGKRSMLSVKYAVGKEPATSNDNQKQDMPSTWTEIPCILSGAEGQRFEGCLSLADSMVFFVCPSLGNGGMFQVPCSTIVSVKATNHRLEEGLVLLLDSTACGQAVPSDQRGNKTLKFIHLPDPEATTHSIKKFVREGKKGPPKNLNNGLLDLPAFFRPGATIEVADLDLLQSSIESTSMDPEQFLRLSPDEMGEITPGARLYMSPVVLFGRCFSDEAHARFLKTLTRTGCIDPKLSSWSGDPYSPQGAYRELFDTIKFARKIPLIPLASPRHTRFRYTIRENGWLHVFQSKVQMPEFPNGKQWHLEVRWVLQYTQDGGTDFTSSGGVYVQDGCPLSAKIKDAITNPFILAPANCISALVRWGGHPTSREKRSGYKFDGLPLPSDLPEKVLDVGTGQVPSNTYTQHPVTPEKTAFQV